MSQEKDLEASILGQISAEDEHQACVAQDLENISMQNRKLGLKETTSNGIIAENSFALSKGSSRHDKTEFLENNDPYGRQQHSMDQGNKFFRRNMVGMSQACLPLQGFVPTAHSGGADQKTDSAPLPLINDMSSSDKERDILNPTNVNDSEANIPKHDKKHKKLDAVRKIMAATNVNTNSNVVDENVSEQTSLPHSDTQDLSENKADVKEPPEQREKKDERSAPREDMDKENKKHIEDQILGFEVDNSSNSEDIAETTAYESYEVPATYSPKKHHDKFLGLDYYDGENPDENYKKNSFKKINKINKPTTPKKQKTVKNKAPGKYEMRNWDTDNWKHMKLELYPNTMLSKVFQIALAASLPVIIIWLSFRLVASSLFISFEYWLLGPVSGMDSGVRQRFADYTLGYLSGNADQSYLEELRLDEAPAFSSAEISHMVDVKNVFNAVTIIMFTALAIAIISLVVLLAYDKSAVERHRIGGTVRKSFFFGAVSTLGIIVLLILAVLFSWNNFFTSFHNYIFPQGNWQFYSNSLLVRIFPEEFWYDTTVALCVLTIIIAVIVALSNWPKKVKKYSARML